MAESTESTLFKNFGVKDSEVAWYNHAFLDPSHYATVYEDHGRGFSSRFFGPGFLCFIGAPVPSGTILRGQDGRKFLVANQGSFLQKNFSPSAYDEWRCMVEERKAMSVAPTRWLRNFFRWGRAARRPLYVPTLDGVAEVVGFDSTFRY